ncbi:MAG: RHS repeat domain-containing protein [bacterium]
MKGVQEERAGRYQEAIRDDQAALIAAPRYALAYQALGNLSQTAYPNGVTSYYAYDPNNRLLTLRTARIAPAT